MNADSIPDDFGQVYPALTKYYFKFHIVISSSKNPWSAMKKMKMDSSHKRRNKFLAASCWIDKKKLGKLGS